MKKIVEVKFYSHKMNIKDKVEFFIDEFENITDNNRLLSIIKMDYPFSIICHLNGEYFKTYDGLEEYLNEDFGLTDNSRDYLDWIEDYLVNNEVWSCSYKF